jgi:two-component system chemotaxis response regulator CheY
MFYKILMITKKTILVVDDSTSIRQILKSSLENGNFYVLEGKDGEDALKHLNGQRIDLVITDLHMPNMNGLELTKEIRNSKDYRYVPVLVLTTETSKSMKEKAKLEGATGWLQKPFDMERLKKTINKLVR